MNKPEYLTPEQVAAWLAITPVYLQNLRLEGKGPPYEIAGQGIRYDRAEVDRWITDNTVTA